MAKLLQDGIAIVTGSDSGIGRATAEEFADEGADVVVTCFRDQEPWEIARLAVHLASADADYVAGQSFTIDGGLMMHLGQGA